MHMFVTFFLMWNRVKYAIKRFMAGVCSITHTHTHTHTHHHQKTSALQNEENC